MEKSKFIDFRSDVVSQPPEAMLKAMTQAEVGDDVFGDDPTTNLFEATIAKSFGKEAAIFFPSASMGSLAVTIGWCKPG
jgi:threonine aldolase